MNETFFYKKTEAFAVREGLQSSECKAVFIIQQFGPVLVYIQTISRLRMEDNASFIPKKCVLVNSRPTYRL